MSRLQLNSYFSCVRQIYNVDFPRVGQTVIAVVHKLIVWVSLPPLKTREKIDHVPISLEHSHIVIPASVEPATTCIRPDIGSLPSGFTGILISTGHHDSPSGSPQ